MKKIIILTVLGLMIGMVLSSCNKDNNIEEPTPNEPEWIDTTVVVPPTIDSTLTYRFRVTGAALTNNINKMIIINGATQLLTKDNVINITCNHGDVVELKLSYMYPDTYQSGKWINVELTKNGNGSNWSVYSWWNHTSPTGFGSQNIGKSFTAYY